MKKYNNLFAHFITFPLLFNAWHAFASGKRKKKDVQVFEERLEDNIAELYEDLVSGKYMHGGYFAFYLHDPKKRHIHKATVRDRVLHRVLYEMLTMMYEPIFIFHSYSARLDKGTHKAVDEAEKMIRSCSGNYSKPCYIMKCDIARFFDSVDHELLFELLGQRIKDKQMMGLLEEVISTSDGIKKYLPKGKGIPLGNLTSQIFSNIYLHELDYYVKQTLRVPNYIRYADDFIIVSSSKNELRKCMRAISGFLKEQLLLQLHHRKVFIVSAHQGLDMLGYLLFPHHRLLRGTTKKRMCRKIREYALEVSGKQKDSVLSEALASYTGLLKHADCFTLSQSIRNMYN